MRTPLLFLIYNRPELTSLVFKRIAEVKPEQLFIAADGAKNEADRIQCEKTRNIVLQNINWNCEIKTLSNDSNLGCGKAVGRAVTWFFNEVEEGIILEDDCFPSISFFKFCEELLNRYRDDKRIMSICGTNPNVISGWDSYHFVNQARVWGWASWRRAWQFYDYSLSSLDEFIHQNRIRYVFPQEQHKQYCEDWLGWLRKTKAGEIDTWDYQWMYAHFINNAFCIAPQKNLIQNIGFGKNATHTTDPNDARKDRPIFETEEIKHPKFIMPG